MMCWQGHNATKAANIETRDTGRCTLSMSPTPKLRPLLLNEGSMLAADLALVLGVTATKQRSKSKCSRSLTLAHAPQHKMHSANTSNQGARLSSKSKSPAALRGDEHRPLPDGEGMLADACRALPDSAPAHELLDNLCEAPDSATRCKHVASAAHVARQLAPQWSSCSTARRSQLGGNASCFQSTCALTLGNLCRRTVWLQCERPWPLCLPRWEH